MVFFESGGYTFNNGFDSGNLGRVEFVKRHTDDLIAPPNHQQQDVAEPQPVNVEFNVWTRPDCAGTQYENTNRTWFYFGIKGGLPSDVCKINVMNLNRQAKLYSHGMHPVVKVGVNGKWERTKDRPSYRMDEENFVMSFIHRGGEDTTVEFFYAFTYPYSYRELQEQLTRLDRRFRKRMFEIQKKSLEENIPLFVEQADLDGLADTGDSTESPESSSSSSSSSSAETLSGPEDLYNEIYYYRELLTYSVERRRIDLVTISSYHGICAEREERLAGLFPETLRHRCHTFKQKKVVFLSSRVHPGETPASFVLNGFIRLLLDRKSVIATTLRRLYVFKIVPFLNPDGVHNGHYRSDTLGHNLNRVYTNPDPKKHPSIYAVRRLLGFYQFGVEKPFGGDGEEAEEGAEKLPENVIVKETEEDKNIVISLKELIMNQLNKAKEEEAPTLSSDDVQSESPSILENKSPSPEIEVGGVENDENRTPSLSLDGLESDSKSSDCSARTPIPRKVSGKAATNTKDAIVSGKNKKATAITAKKEFRSKSSCGQKKVMSARYKSSQTAVDIINESSMGHLSGIDFHNLYNHFESEVGAEKVEDKTNLFLYIDFHGHASKKGIFIFGNHMAHPLQAVECMLLPKLMSLNSHHFHFDACNFSERNMYHKGKRDGLSKEGSGRVAIYKATGLIRCYTLECNYNTGKYVNVLPPRGKDKTCKAVNLVPPKYTPEIFEQTGRALGASLLDLSNSNPLSRLGNSEYRTLQGLRNALRLDIEKTFTKNQLLLKAAKGKLKRLKSVLSLTGSGSAGASSSASTSSTTTTTTSADVFKENKGYWTGPPLNRTSAVKFRSVGNVKNTTTTTTTLYGKKERSGGSRKKGKSVLGDSKLFQDQQATTSLTVPLLNLVPVKRLKATAPNPVADDLSPGPSTCSSSSAEESRTPPVTASSSQSEEASPSVKFSRIPVFKRPPVPSTSKGPSKSSTIRGTVASKKSSCVMDTEGGGCSTATTATGGGGGGGGVMTKLKNKRSLKSDATTVKRKKSRAKSVWH